MSGFWDWLFPKPPPDPIPVPAIDAAPKSLGDLLRRASSLPSGSERAKAFAEIYPVAQRPPGVPESAQVAMDGCMQDVYAYADLGAFGGGWGLEGWLGYPYLSQLAQRSEYRAIFETRAKEMTRKWIELTYADDKADEGDKLAKIEECMREKRLRDHFRKCAEHDGAFGIGHIYIDTGKTENPDELAKPLLINSAKIPKGGKLEFRVVEPIWTYPNDYNALDPLRPDFYRPNQWYVQGKVVHASRLLTMISAEVPDILKAAYAFGGVSLSQRAKPYVDNWLRTRQSVSDITHSFSIVALLTNMGGTLAGQASDDLFNRVDVFNLMRDNRGTFVLDKDTEDLKILAAPLGTLDHLQAQAQEQLLSVSQTPDIKLFGITPTGLNSSTDGVIRVYYDNILSVQEHIFRDNLKIAIDTIQLHLFGKIDPRIGFNFVSLWEMDPAAEASIRKADADTAAVYMQEGVISPEETRGVLARDPKSPYRGLDPDDVPEEPDEGVQERILGDPAKSAEGGGEERSGV
jgi:phage-related protein (TIGR01555 family)